MTEAILLNESEAAAALSITQRTLREWRRRGEAPPSIRLNARVIRYRPEDLREWAVDRLRASTAEEADQ